MTDNQSPTQPKNARDYYTGINIRKADARPLAIHITETGETRPQWLSRMLKRDACKHPRGKRIAMTATYNLDGDAINAEEACITVPGFHCEACGQYIFNSGASQKG